jgi:hypothetical protein
MPLTRFKMYQLRLELTSLSSHILDCQSEQLSVYLAVTIVCYVEKSLNKNKICAASAAGPAWVRNYLAIRCGSSLSVSTIPKGESPR